MSAYDLVSTITLTHEGGWGCDPRDRGNWTGGAIGAGELRGTKFGISAAAFPHLDIQNLTIDQARTILHDLYWVHVAGDALPAPVGLLLFDWAVNSGVAGAVEPVQRMLAVKADGDLGPITQAAIARGIDVHGLKAFCSMIQAQRLIALAALPQWQHNAGGWAARLCDVLIDAITLISSSRGALPAAVASAVAA